MIRVIQPAWPPEERADRALAFWAEIDASTDYVVSVAVLSGAGFSFGGLFSTHDRALEWAAAQCLPCVLEARRIDCPDWGQATVH